jgi:predicted metal-dependent hydrolase
LPYLGAEIPLVVKPAPARRVTVALVAGAIEIAVSPTLDAEPRLTVIEHALEGWYRARAAEEITERIAAWSQETGWQPRAVLIRDQRRRWGSCSADGTLRFNWRLVMAPPSVIDYVVVHELAHLRVHNHSPAFWAEVARHIPDHKARRAALRQLGPSLSLWER